MNCNLYFLKYLIAEGSSGYNGWALSKEQAKSMEHLLWTICFDSGHLQYQSRRPDMERKYVSSDKSNEMSPS